MTHSKDKNNIFYENSGNSDLSEKQLFESLQWSILQQEVIAEIIPLLNKDNEISSELLQESLEKISNVTEETLAIYRIRQSETSLELKAKSGVKVNSQNTPDIPGHIVYKDQSDFLKVLRHTKVIQLNNNPEVSSAHAFLQQYFDSSKKPWWIFPLKIKEKIYGLFAIDNPNTNSINNMLFSFYKTIALVYAQAFDRVTVVASNKEMVHKLERANQLKTAFLTNISHEVRTPVNSIVGFSDLLADPDLTIDQREEFITMITRSSRMLVRMFDNIIDASKLKSEQIHFRYEWVNTNYILKEIEHEMEDEEDRFDDNVYFYTITKTEAPTSIYADVFRLKQAIKKLTDNAIEHTNEGEIEVGALIKDQKLVIYVKDSGKGIDKVQNGEIFNLFESKEHAFTLNSGGSGLGLSIAKEMIEQMGGTIWFESEMNKGTTFFIAFPEKNYRIEQKKAIQKSEKPNDWSDRSILIAEDVEFNYIFLREIIIPTGATVHWAKNGVEACQIVEDYPDIDLVLMDLQMPEMNGYDAAKKIKTQYPNITIIAQTAFMMSNEDEKCFQIGCDGFLSKPIRHKLLINEIKKFFD